MSNPNPREMDVARSLVNMAHVQGQFPTADGQYFISHEELAARSFEQKWIKREYDAYDNYQAPVYTHQQRPAVPENPDHDLMQHYATMNAGEQNLQNHLIRQQLLAGVAPENIIPMNQRSQDNVNVQRAPNLLQITNDGVTAPRIPPATFIPRAPYPRMQKGTVATALPELLHGGPNEIHFEPYATAPDMDFAGNIGPYGTHIHPPRRPATAFSYHSPENTCAPNVQTQAFRPTTALNSVAVGYIPGPDGTMLRPEHVYFPPNPNPHMQQTRISGTAIHPFLVRETPALHGTQEYYARDTEGRRPTVSNIGEANELQMMHWNSLQQSMTGLPEQIHFKQETAHDTREHGYARNTITPRPQFDIIAAILRHPEIALLLTGELYISDLLNLQAMSRPFHAFIIKHLPKVIKLQVQRRLPVASHIFPWRCYRNLWFTSTVPHNELVPGNLDRSTGPVIAFAPSFRWLQMVKYRDQTVNCILKALKDAGCGVPCRYKAAVLKLWFLMDIPDMRRRLWTVQNPNLWTDLDIFMAIFFVARIDMFVKSKRGNPTGGQRRLIMAQPTLTFCHDVLAGRALKDDMEILRAFIRWRHTPTPGQPDTELFGVPSSEVGSLQYEYYGRRARNTKLSRPDEIIIREAQKRRLNYRDMYRLIFMNAQTDIFTVCERRNIPWDMEATIALDDKHGTPAISIQLDSCCRA